MSITKRVFSESTPILIFVATVSPALTDSIVNKEKILIKISAVIPNLICDLKDKIIP